MNPSQRTAYDMFVRRFRKTYPVIRVRYPRTPMTHVSIMVSQYYDLAPYERAQINDMGVITYL